MQYLATVIRIYCNSTYVVYVRTVNAFPRDTLSIMHIDFTCTELHLVDRGRLGYFRGYLFLTHEKLTIFALFDLPDQFSLASLSYGSVIR